MARMPNATWKPLPKPSTARMARYDLVVIHTMVGSLAGTDGYFRRLTNGVNSHFGTGGAGEIWQWVDTAVQSGANGAGNHRTITVENADMGPGFAAWNTKDGNAVPAFTPQQIEANAQICAWAHLQHGVPLVAADSSRPNARGIGYHRLGCDPHRVPDGERWSSSYGKTCPAPRRIAQIPQIIARAQQIVGGLANQQQEDDMPLNDADKNWIFGTVLNIVRSEGISGANESAGNALTAVTSPIPSVIDPNVKLSPRQMLAAIDGATWTAVQQLAALTGSLNAVAAALKGGTGGDGFTVDEAVAAGRAGAEAALSELGDKLRAQA